LQCLILQILPPKLVIVSVFLLVGPLCMHGIAAIILGQTSLEVLPKMHVIHLLAGVVFYCLDVPCAVMLMVFACLWLGLAITPVCYANGSEFNLG
jgi:hypothetical protein